MSFTVTSLSGLEAAVVCGAGLLLEALCGVFPGQTSQCALLFADECCIDFSSFEFGMPHPLLHKREGHFVQHGLGAKCMAEGLG